MLWSSESSVVKFTMWTVVNRALSFWPIIDNTQRPMYIYDQCSWLPIYKWHLINYLLYPYFLLEQACLTNIWTTKSTHWPFGQILTQLHIKVLRDLVGLEEVEVSQGGQVYKTSVEGTGRLQGDEEALWRNHYSLWDCPHPWQSFQNGLQRGVEMQQAVSFLLGILPTGREGQRHRSHLPPAQVQKVFQGLTKQK